MVEVYDELFDESFIFEMDKHVRTLPFSQIEVDTEKTHLNQGMSTDFDFEHPMILKMKNVFSKYLENSELQRAYCNKIRNTDTPQPHTDSKYETDKTVLYYVNKEYDMGWGGETLFYQDDVKAIVPVPGRVAIFSGNILHTARPFLMHIIEPRYTIAFKYVFSF